MARTTVKIIGSSGQGIDSIGEILAKALKQSGYCVFGYREYPSLIKGGIASYQIDISNQMVESSSVEADVIVGLNHHALIHHTKDLAPGGIFIHATKNWTMTEEQEERRKTLHQTFIELPIEEIVAEYKAKPIIGNTIFTGFLWSLLGGNIELLKERVGEKFQKKKDLLTLNMECIERGIALHKHYDNLMVRMPETNAIYKNHLLITGSKAMGLGAIAAGVRLYAGYPMTPSSPLLNFIASTQNETGMVIKQAEDEITAAQFVSGAMLMGTRALTATSGGGFDLMSETLSLNAIIENPTVFVLAQRPGPATGLPTWTAQGDVLMSIFTGHGEFTRCVMSVSNAEDAFPLMAEAFNIAEKYQISVIVLLDKQIAEALYVTPPFSNKQITIERGKLMISEEELKNLKATDRYDPHAEDGISVRWLPGSAGPTFVSQGDEHSADGSVDESSKNAIMQMEKRLKKNNALKRDIPKPIFFLKQKGKEVSVVQMNNSEILALDVLLIGFGSTKSVIIDVMQEGLQGDDGEEKTVGYIHYTYLWPLNTEMLSQLMEKSKEVMIVEGNATAQLKTLIRMESGIDIKKTILKYDGRPFFFEELRDNILSAIK